MDAKFYTDTFYLDLIKFTIEKVDLLTRDVLSILKIISIDELISKKKKNLCNIWIHTDKCFCFKIGIN